MDSDTTTSVAAWDDSRRMARVAHELNTPVSLISGSLENLQESLATLVRYVEATDKYLTASEEMARLRADLRLDHRLRDTVGLLEICAEGARRLNHVVAQLRSAGAPDLHSQTDLRAVIDAAVAMAAHGRDRCPLVVVDSRPSDIIVNVNRQSLGQVLLNLVRNAFDALQGKADGRVDIEARIGPTAGRGDAREKTAFVLVRDNGPGIPTADRERVFEEGVSSKTKQGGQGLGLAISREIMRGIGGSLVLTSRNNGAEFEIAIPLDRDGAGS